MTIQVLEYQPIYVSQKYQKELEELAKKTQFLGFNRSGKIIAQNYVGIVRTKKGLTLEILPKVGDLKNPQIAQKILLKMLQALPTFPLKHYQDASLATQKHSLLEIFISLFVQEVQRVVKKGIGRAYVQKEENLRFCRGKLIIHEQIRRNLIHKERFFVRYDEYRVDRLENRILKEALLVARKLSSSLSNQRGIDELLCFFGEVSRLKELHRLKYLVLERTMGYYEDALRWAKLFLFGEYPKVGAGEFGAWSLLFDVGRLFERYVGARLQRLCSGVKLQDRSRYLFDDPKIRHLKPDIVIRDEVVVDTKWKEVKRFEDISSIDLYQLFAYGVRYPKVKRVVLLVPSLKETKVLGSYRVHICEKDVKFECRYFCLKDENGSLSLCEG